MEENIVIYHHGVKGQKWGVRRFQNKDGSLTRLGKKRLNKDDKDKLKKQKEADKAKKKAASAEAAKKKAEEAKMKEQETVEQRRARLLKSNDAQELYNNRHLLSTAEINERLNRIDTEKRLGAEAEKSKVTLGKKARKIIDSAKNVANMVEDVYQITQKPFFKSLMKSLKGEEVKKDFDMEEQLKNINKLSNQEVADLSKRLLNTKAARDAAQKIKDMDNEAREAAAAAKRKQQAEKDAETAAEKTRQIMANAAKGKGSDSQEFKNWTNSVLADDLAKFNSKNFNENYNAAKAAINNIPDDAFETKSIFIDYDFGDD